MLLIGTSSAWAKTFSKGDVLFIDATSCSWYEGDGCNASIYFWGTNTIGPVHTTRISDRLYCYTFTSAVTVSNFKVFRQPTNSSGWDNQYNGIESDFNSMSTHNTIKINGNSDNYSWTDYKPTSTGKLSASSTNVKTGEGVTLTPSLTSNTTYNTIKSTTYSISPSTGASISGSTFTATKAGTYTVTATITYNPKGYSSLTSTVQPTVTITVTQACTPPTLTLTNTSADANKGDEVNLTTLSGAKASSGTVEWYTSTTSTTATSASVTVSATKTYYARAVEDCKSDAKTFTINAKCTKDFYLVGASADIFGSSWSPAQAANKMDCDLNTLTKTYTNITVAANTTIEYKYTGANGWKDAEYPTSGNSSFTISTAGKYNITFTAQTNGSTITGTPTVTWELACINLPDDAYSIKSENKTAEWTGSNITPTITKKDNNYPNPTVTYNGKSALPKDVDSYTVKAIVSGDATYCDKEFDLGTFTITCPALTAPTVSVYQHIVKCGTDVTQKGKITISGLVSGNTYTYKVGDNGTAKSLTFTGNTATLDNLAEGGEYIVTASNGCTTTSVNATVNVTTNTKATLSWNMPSPSKDFLVAGETITAKLEPAAAGTIKYTSTNEAIIKVQDGLTPANDTIVGEATIKATANLGNNYCGATSLEQKINVKFFNVAGTENLCGEPWHTTLNPMTYEDGVWKKSFTNIAAGDFQFKINHTGWTWQCVEFDQDNSNITGQTKEDGQGHTNIVFSTPTKGNITVYYSETTNKAYLNFEPICLEQNDVTATVTVPNGDYKYQDQAKFTLDYTDIATIGYGTSYTPSIEWFKNGTKIEGQAGKTLTVASLEAGVQTYKAKVTWTPKADIGCTASIIAEKEVEIDVECPAPADPQILAQQDRYSCNKVQQQVGQITIDYDPTLKYKIGINNKPLGDDKISNDGKINITSNFGSTLKIYAVNTCNSIDENIWGVSAEGAAFIINTHSKTPTVPTLTPTNIVACGINNENGSIKIDNIAQYSGNNFSFKLGEEAVTPVNGVISEISEEGDYTVSVTDSYKLESGDFTCSSSANTTVALTNNTPSATVTLSTDKERLCADNDVVLTCDVKDVDGTITGYVWKNANGEQVATGEGLSTITIKNVTASTTYSVVVTVDKNGCSKDFESSVNLDVKSRPEAPKFDDEKMTACTGVPFSLPMPNNLKEGEEPVWTIEDKLIPAGNVTLGEKGDYEFKAYKNDGCISDATKFIVTVKPTPAITLSADNETVNVGETVTLSVSGSDFAELKWSATDGTKSYTVTPGANNTATITTDENALITVTVVAKSEAGCETSASIDLTFGSEDCENANADYIEILCRNITTSSKPTRDMYCYAWDPNTDKTYLGGWPGVKTDDGEFEYKGNKYAVWQIKTNTDLSIIFNNNSGRQTEDISGLKKGYRYVYEIKESTTDGNKYTYELKEESIIFAPEVKTLSATYARQSDNTLKVTVTGKIMKKGCASISSYGFQQIYNNGYTNFEVGTTDQDAGFIFTKDITLEAGKYGEYTFRARLINENSSKVYGEKITIYYSETDVLIAAVGDDTKVTNKSGVYYDFVGLYVKNVMLPQGTKVKSYQWYKGDAVYNDGNVTVADRGVSAANNNIRPSEAGAYKCVVTLDNNTTLTSNVINVTETETYSDKVNATNRNLPVISVRTNVAFPTCETAGTTGKYPSTNIEGWKEKRSVDVKIFNADGTLYYDRKARMNYRGSSSLNFNKKSYAFCPGDADCGNDKGADYVETKKMNLFGLSNGAEDKDWVLYAAAADPTLMRNRLVFDTYAEMTGKWGVNSMYVELVIDGEYQGVYVLMDKITNNKKRVYVGKYGDKDYSGGFIVKFDKTDVADRERNLVAGQEIGDEKTFRTVRTGRTDVYTYGTYVDQLFEIEYPEKKDVEKAGASWSTTLNAIKQRFQDFEDALEKGEFLKVRSIIDYESWADWFIINEFTKNLDAYRASCVFTCEGEGQKIKALPLWDQELSFNNGAANISGKGADKTNGLLIENDGVYKDCFPAPFWFTGRVAYFNNCGVDGGESSENPRLEYYLLKDECFIQTIKDRWAKHIAEGGPLHKKTLTDKVDVLLSELGAAKSRETTKWPSNHRVNAACSGGVTGYNNVGFDASKTALVNWVGGELNANATSESSSNSRVTNLNYLINKMQGDPLQFNLVLNPANGVTTPWVPVTLTVEAPAGYDYTYDDSEVEAAEGVIIKKLGNDAYSYTFPRPEAWGSGNNANTSDPRDPRYYGVKVTLNVETIDNTCGTVDTEKHATIILEDEGDDNCSYTNK